MLTIPKGTSFDQWTKDLNAKQGTNFESKTLAKQLGLNLSDQELQVGTNQALNVDLKGVDAQTEREILSFSNRQSNRGADKANSVFNIFGAEVGGRGKHRIIRGPASGYTVTDTAKKQVADGKITEQDVMDASTRSGNAINNQVGKALKAVLADNHLTMKELKGNRFARALRYVGLKIGNSLVTAMKHDSALQLGKIDPNDYRVFNDLLRRADLPEGNKSRITLEDGVRTEIENSVRKFQDQLLDKPQTSAFVEEVDGDLLVNQTAMKWAAVDTGTFLDNLPPEFWAEDCHDLKSIHSEVLSREEREDGGYKMTMLQRMEFGEGPTATDMTKLTVVEKWQDDNGEWHGKASWKVFESGPTEQIAHKDSMVIDQGRMEFAPVERDGKKCTEITFNNQTMTNTALEKKLFDWIMNKDHGVRARVSAELASSKLPMGIHGFAGSVVGRYDNVGSGETPARWPELRKTHVTEAE